MPMGDYLLADTVAEKIARKASAAGHEVYIAPVLPFGGTDFWIYAGRHCTVSDDIAGRFAGYAAQPAPAWSDTSDYPERAWRQLRHDS